VKSVKEGEDLCGYTPLLLVGDCLNPELGLKLSLLLLKHGMKRERGEGGEK
jgi:hypothetical protein